MDEVFDSSLDGFGTEEFLKIIRYVITNVNVFVISHKSGLEDRFESVLRFEKMKGFNPEDMKITHASAYGGRIIKGSMPRAQGRATDKKY
jgi:undecaprenyl pyrophosphate synthase